MLLLPPPRRAAAAAAAAAQPRSLSRLSPARQRRRRQPDLLRRLCRPVCLPQQPLDLTTRLVASPAACCCVHPAARRLRHQTRGGCRHARLPRRGVASGRCRSGGRRPSRAACVASLASANAASASTNPAAGDGSQAHASRVPPPVVRPLPVFDAAGIGCISRPRWLLVPSSLRLTGVPSFSCAPPLLQLPLLPSPEHSQAPPAQQRPRPRAWRAPPASTCCLLLPPRAGASSQALPLPRLCACG